MMATFEVSKWKKLSKQDILVSLRSITKLTPSPWNCISFPSPSSMTSSILLSGTDLLQETVNSGNSVWIKPGATFAVPVAVEKEGAALTWEFSSQPKVSGYF